MLNDLLQFLTYLSIWMFWSHILIFSLIRVSDADAILTNILLLTFCFQHKLLGNFLFSSFMCKICAVVLNIQSVDVLLKYIGGLDQKICLNPIQFLLYYSVLGIIQYWIQLSCWSFPLTSCNKNVHTLPRSILCCFWRSTPHIILLQEFMICPHLSSSPGQNMFV